MLVLLLLIIILVTYWQTYTFSSVVRQAQYQMITSDDMDAIEAEACMILMVLVCVTATVLLGLILLGIIPYND